MRERLEWYRESVRESVVHCEENNFGQRVKAKVNFKNRNKCLGRLYRKRNCRDPTVWDPQLLGS